MGTSTLMIFIESNIFRFSGYCYFYTIVHLLVYTGFFLMFFLKCKLEVATIKITSKIILFICFQTYESIAKELQRITIIIAEPTKL